MIKEFCKVTGITEEDISARWSDVEGRVLRYAAFNDKKGVKSLLSSHNEYEEKMQVSGCHNMLHNHGRRKMLKVGWAQYPVACEVRAKFLRPRPLCVKPRPFLHD